MSDEYSITVMAGTVRRTIGPFSSYADADARRETILREPNVSTAVVNTEIYI